MKPRIPITDKRFRYVPSHKTNVRETFERMKREREGVTSSTIPFTRTKR